MAGIDRWLCIVNIENKQEDYAKVSVLLTELEHIEQGEETGKLEFPIKFQIARNDKDCLTSAVLKTLEYELESPSGRTAEIKSWNQLLKGLAKNQTRDEFSLYVRVDMSDGAFDLANLRYLVLLLQSHPTVWSRGAVFLWSESEASADRQRLYFRCSNFLRLAQEKYRCFYAVYDQAPQPLTQREPGVHQTFVPLIEIDRETYGALRRPGSVSLQFQNQPFSELYQALQFSAARPGPSEAMLAQIGLRALFNNFNGNQYKTDEKKEELLTLFAGLMNSVGGITPLDILLFGILFDRSADNALNPEQLRGYLVNIQLFSAAVAQLLENIVFHSALCQGVFTIRLHKGQEYIQENYPGYSLSDTDRGLELLIADANSQDSILDHFLESGKATASLRLHRDELKLADFFQEKLSGSAARFWQEARDTHPEMCHGLRSFSRMVEEFGGTFHVRSSPSFFGMDAKSCYKIDQTVLDGQYWMPGTQFSAIFRRAKFQKRQQVKASVFDQAHTIYTTTYHDLARSLQFKRAVEPIFREKSVQQLSKKFADQGDIPAGQVQKDTAVNCWKEWFNQRIAEYSAVKDGGSDKDEYILLSAEMRGFQPSREDFPGELEAFCKGFFSSKIFQKRGDHLRYIILMYNLSGSLSCTLYQTLGIMYRNMDTSATGVYFYQEAQAPQAGERISSFAVPYFSSSMQEILHQFSPELPEQQEGFPRTVPYLLLPRAGARTTQFEEVIAEQAQVSILNWDRQGHKIEDTHMRLGNKVHIDSFFEMSLFFENPNYAYYTAFLILQRLKNDEKFIQARKILVYGYASYSRGIVWALIQIWRNYLSLEHGEKEPPQMEFVIYQNDLKLESDHSNVQMYYSKESWQRDARNIWNPEETYLLQIVPISSSMTTFNKMLAEFCLATGKEDFRPQMNLTAFWVRDDFQRKSKEGGRGSESAPTEEEEGFWDHVDCPQQTVCSSTLRIQVQYLVSVMSYWRNPLKCEKCFPSDPLMEIPLVETDPTSTVPTQQFYLKTKETQTAAADSTAEEKNDARVAKLRGNLLYGHISRGHNHFQFYIRTRRYFLQERDSIAEWLRWLAQDEKAEETGRGHIDVLVIPKITSNVEFGQIVYENYFKGEAENIIVNTEKEFRSNFLAEYNGLAKRLIRERNCGRELRFHYIDMSIDSGMAFRRASDLVRSLLNQICELEGQEVDFRFDNIFLMFNRMSKNSKRSYVQDPDHHFHAYVNLYISNMRSYGDSCIPCKLRKEAKSYYQNAAIKSTSAFWEKKYFSYNSVPFDSPDLLTQDKWSVFETAYYKMACAHKASYHIDAVRGDDMKHYFAALRSFFTEIQNAFNNQSGPSSTSPIYEELRERKDTALDWFSAALKILVRPFFSFDYQLRCAVLDLYLLLTEEFLSPRGDDITQTRFEAGKGYLTQDDLTWVKGLANDLESALEKKTDLQKQSEYRLDFIQHILLKGLADLKSNYIMRSETILRVFQTACSAQLDPEEQKNFFERYRRSILRLVHNSSDETKSLWLEYLLQFHEEYPGKYPGQRKLDFDRVPEAVRQDLQEFCDLLLVENNRPLLQGVQNLYRTSNEGKSSERDGLRKYNMRNVCHFLSFSHQKTGPLDEKDEEIARTRLMPLVELNKLLMISDVPAGNVRQQGTNPLQRYNELQKVLQAIVRPGGDSKDILEQVLLLGPQKQPTQGLPERSQYYLISPQPPIDYKGQTRYDRALKGLEEPIRDHSSELTTWGFSLLEKDGRYNVILMLDNNFDMLGELPVSSDYQGQKIEPMYIFLPCHTDRNRALTLVREILMFRCSLVAWLEQDFNNNAISALVRQRYWAETLAADKVGDHNEQDFIECVRRVLCEDSDGQDNRGLYEESDVLGRMCETIRAKADGTEKFLTVKMDKAVLDELRRWYLLCSYVNSRIARLYRTFAQEASHEGYALSEEYILDQIKEYYDRSYKAVGRECADSVRDVFFMLIEAESSRRDYLAQILKVAAFTLVDGANQEDDTAEGDDIESRLSFLRRRLGDFRCVQFSKNGVEYGYLAEYLAVIILDCCISALKVSRTWQLNKSGYETFLALRDCPVEDKCRITLRRLPCSDKVDYLSIENEVHLTDQGGSKNGPGMSQDAIRWYVDKLWKFRLDRDLTGSSAEDAADIPHVKTSLNEGRYQILLPILEKKGTN